jgi:hypothetical protein
MTITVASTKPLTYKDQRVLDALSQRAAPIEITALAEELRKTFGATVSKLAETLLFLVDEKCVERIEGAASSGPRYVLTFHGLARLIAAETNAILSEPINPQP